MRINIFTSQKYEAHNLSSSTNHEYAVNYHAFLK